MSLPSNKKSLVFHLTHAIKDRLIECVIFLIAGSVGGFINRKLFTEHLRPTIAIIAIYGVASVLWAFKKYRSDRALWAHLDEIAASEQSNNPYRGMFADASDAPPDDTMPDRSHPADAPTEKVAPPGPGVAYPGRKELP